MEINMSNKKKIALLNFPLDNNFGGNLQRYALMRVLNEMGYDVTHLSTQFQFEDNCSAFKRITSYIKYKFGLYPSNYIPAWIRQSKYKKGLKAIMPFYNRYIKHTNPIYNYENLCAYQDFDIYLVGSDQVWRRSMNGFFPYTAMFFDFIKQPDKRKIAYGISLGTTENELSEEDLQEVTPLYKKFYATSVRENTALSLFEQYGWTSPVAQAVLDPTLLLNKAVYNEIISDGRTRNPNGHIFCYVLDFTKEKERMIRQTARDLGGKTYMCSLEDNTSIGQWLRNIRDAKYVITDSYHGVLFSIIFNRPFLFLENQRRGNERVSHIIKLLGVNPEYFDWSAINQRIDEEQEKSISFLREVLK